MIPLIGHDNSFMSLSLAGDLERSDHRRLRGEKSENSQTGK